jgi:hypothetical protein
MAFNNSRRAVVAAALFLSRGAANDLNPDRAPLHVLTGVARTVAISGSQSEARRASLAVQYGTLGRGTPELTFFDGVSGASLEARAAPPEGELWFRDSLSGLQVRAWDWTTGGLGGPGMDLPTVARIAACACSHVLAARDALAVGAFPTLVVEDDVTFAPLLEQPGGTSAVAAALRCAANVTDEQWGLVQMGYLLPSPYVAAQGLRHRGQGVRLRDACSAHFHVVGIQVTSAKRGDGVGGPGPIEPLHVAFLSTHGLSVLVPTLGVRLVSAGRRGHRREIRTPRRPRRKRRCLVQRHH